MSDTKISVLGIAGSPRRSGNSELLLDQFLVGAESGGAEVAKVLAARLKIAGCIECDRCWSDGRCVVQDEFQDLYERLIAADIIVLATPVFFAGLPAQLKAVIDRSQCQWARKFKLKAPLAATPAGHSRRRGVLLAVGGDAREDFSGVIQTAKRFFDVQEADFWGRLLYAGVDAKNEILDHPTAMQEAYDLGVRAATDKTWKRQRRE